MRVFSFSKWFFSAMHETFLTVWTLSYEATKTEFQKSSQQWNHQSFLSSAMIVYKILVQKPPHCYFPWWSWVGGASAPAGEPLWGWKSVLFRSWFSQQILWDGCLFTVTISFVIIFDLSFVNFCNIWQREGLQSFWPNYWLDTG